MRIEDHKEREKNYHVMATSDSWISFIMLCNSWLNMYSSLHYWSPL